MASLDPNSFDWSIINDSTFRRKLRIRNAADRDDAVQDAWIKLRTSPSITRALLMTTIVNCDKDRVKADRRQSARARDRVMRNSDPTVKPVTHRRSRNDTRACEERVNDHTSHHGSHGVSARLQRQETRRAIKRAARAAGLSRDHRCALWAWMRDRLAEFSRRRGIKPVTARVWVNRALEKLRPHMEREGLGPD